MFKTLYSLIVEKPYINTEGSISIQPVAKLSFELRKKKFQPRSFKISSELQNFDKEQLFLKFESEIFYYFAKKLKIQKLERYPMSLFSNYETTVLT